MNKKSLGFGLMRLPMVDGKVDIPLCCEMADRFMAAGGTYFDTALMYCGEQSEAAVREIVTHRYPRDAFTVATKLHSGFFETLEDRDRVFSAQLERMGVEYFDYYLIHAIDRNCYDKYTRLDCFEWLKQKKAQGLVRHIGFSFHDSADFLERGLTEHPEMEFVQLQLNYLDWDSEDVQSRKCYETARRFDKPIVFYGSSITQGGVASRPGNAYTAIASRRLCCDHINLGFSGSAKGESEIAEYIAGLDMKAFVYDYDHNAPNSEHLRLTHEKLYRRIRESHSDIPYIMISKPTGYEHDRVRRAIIMDTYRNAVNDGDENVYFLDGATLFVGDEREACTVDGCHPNDLGFYRFAKALEPILKACLK